MKLSEELVWRGFVAEHTFERVEDLDARAGRKFYWGTDPSADSLHVGHLAALMMCGCFIRHGYEPTLLVGGATGQIGDPKDDAERELKGLEEIERNKVALAAQIERVAQVEGLRMVDNLDWFRDVKFLPFLREIFKEFSLTQMLDRKFVRDRIGEGGAGISLAEFVYTTIQGYDFLHLYRESGVDLQLCGADQFGNCVSGMQLIRKLEGAEADVWSCPLIIDKVTGRKFGKSEGNAVWLDTTKTSVFDFYQFWLNQADEAVEGFLKVYTLMGAEEVGELMRAQAADPGARVAQKRLAYGVTSVVHGVEAAESVARVTEVLFGGAASVSDLSDGDISLLVASGVPVAERGSVVDALVASGVAKSRGEARQLMSAGAIAMNGEKILEDVVVTERAIIKKGKNKFILVK